MKAVQLNIPLGYSLKSERREACVEEARSVFLTKRQDSITEAYRDGIRVLYVRHYIECPICNHKVYAYARRFNKEFGCNLSVDDRIDKKSVLDWTTRQIGFFDDERGPLVLSRVVDTDALLTCPRCKNTICRSDKTRSVEIWRDAHKVYVRAELVDVSEYLSQPCAIDGDIYAESRLFEVACFNFRNGHTWLRLEREDGERLSVRDVTCDKYVWTSGAVYNTILKSKYARRIIRRMFCEEWQREIPFCPSELGVNELRQLVMFKGYGKEFYSTIPFEEGTTCVEESFKRQAEPLRDCDNIVSLYESSELPNMKSVRKIFFENPGLFFYIKECERLWRLLSDPNHFVAFFRINSLYQILSDLHSRPVIFVFLEDFLKLESKTKLLKRIRREWRSTCDYAINYGTMSPSMQKHERKIWKTDETGTSIGSIPYFAIPMSKPREQIRNCVIDGFEFFWLKTSADYREASCALNNCLRAWSQNDYPVICVRYKGKIVASIELMDNTVYQAYSTNNEGLHIIEGLDKAYHSWCDKNALAESPIFCCDDYEDLPF